jgi:hypothetical protein
VSFLDRVQRTSNGAIKRCIGNDFPHFQPHLIYSALPGTPRVNPAQSRSKKVPFNFGWTLPGRWASIITLKCSQVGRRKCMPPINLIEMLTSTTMHPNLAVPLDAVLQATKRKTSSAVLKL